MQIQCPTCRTQLSIAGVQAAQVQCPGCHTVLDISGFTGGGAPAAAMPSAAGPRSAAPRAAGPRASGPRAAGLPAAVVNPALHAQPTASPAGQYGAYASATVAAAPTPTAPAPSSSVRVRRKKNPTGLWVVGGLLVVAVAVGMVFLLKGLGGSGRAEAPPVVQQARALVSQELALPADVRFGSEYETREAKPGLWLVQSHVDIRARDQYLRRKWKAELSERNGQFELRSLTVDGQRQPIGREAQAVSMSSGGPGAEGPPETSSTPTPPGEDRTIGGAVDRIAREVSSAVKQRKTLVVWLLDESISASSWRDSLSQHSQTVLDLLKHDQLSMAVLGFGRDVKFLVKDPSRDVAEIAAALEGSETEAPGEATFQAIKMAAETYRGFRQEGGYVFLVVVSDEAGDDPQLADELAVALKRDSISLYAIGKEAPLGRSTWDTVDTSSGPAPADRETQGPESFASERIALSFWNQGYSDPGVVGSGYGPFALSKLCLQSGGEYFVCDGAGSSRRSTSSSSSSSMTFRSWSGSSSSSWASGGPSRAASTEFPVALRRKYAPDYVTEAEYQALLQSNGAYKALVEAGRLPQVDVGALLQYDFPVQNEAALRRSLDEAQRAAARLEPKLSELYEKLSAGERDRAKVTSPRWQASFDLAMGRILAARARIEGYNAMLAQLKLGKKFENEGSSRWILDPADTLAAGSNYEKMITQAKTYLERVTTEHANTPWAMLAQRELESKMGWEWVEK